MSLKYEITKDWRRAWRWLQVQAGLLVLVAPELYAQSDTIRSLLPTPWDHRALSVLGFLMLMNALRKKVTTA